ncbi:DUF3887 domain-containing protein [Enterococcus rivorum]|uniref:DUF3887 domain-containing protein n=1 Tax=Enterococcus rivorum TaxID=762845 RepID=A0A1E5KWX1_9ENTE|nr:DUF3887 domain-containing protein [Enterococcus rivorum]MBP2097296.1 PBP1b-binding outer membrane lipoprotein LpoB [Enterococcus rivorum]OEH82352.1 hypothetical protein BCR26_02670 [Enterococcus rivorum]
MRKKWRIVALFMGLFLLVACSGGEKVDEKTSQKYQQKAEEVVAYLNEKNYDQLISRFNKEMTSSLSKEQLKEVEPIIVDSGEFKKFEKSTVKKVDSNYTVVLVTKYEKEKRVYTISFDKNDEISGLYVK